MPRKSYYIRVTGFITAVGFYRWSTGILGCVFQFESSGERSILAKGEDVMPSTRYQVRYPVFFGKLKSS